MQRSGIEDLRRNRGQVGAPWIYRVLVSSSITQDLKNDRAPKIRVFSLVFVYCTEMEFGFAALVFLQSGPERVRLKMRDMFGQKRLAHDLNLRVIVLRHTPEIGVSRKNESMAGIKL